MEAWYVFERVEGKGNPWTIMRPGAVDDRDRAKAMERWGNRVQGREAKALKLEKLRWTPEDILELVGRGLLSR